MKKNIRMAQWPFFYGYMVAFIGTIGIWASVPGQTIGVSTFTDPVKDAMGLTRGQFSAAYMIGTVMSAMLLERAGRWFDRKGARVVAVSSAVLLATSLLVASFSDVLSNSIIAAFGFRHWSIPFVVMLLLFFLLRFSGQGMLTMASRNMIMKWFDRYRGRVNAFVSISISLGFSSSPLLFDWLIRQWEWAGAWRVLALSILVLSVFMWMFYRDNPEEMGLVPDGKPTDFTEKEQPAKALKQFLPQEAFATRAFWAYALMLSFNSFFITGLSFHMIDIFTSAGFDRQQAVAFFLPISVVSLSVSLLFNFLSDLISLKKLLYAMIAGGFVWAVGLIGLSGGWGLWAVVGGAGMCGGLFAVLNSVTWPKLFGRRHLGAISGRAMSMLVFASALAPFLFSLSKTVFNTYTSMGWLALVFIVGMAVFSTKANNPQPVREEEAAG